MIDNSISNSSKRRTSRVLKLWAFCMLHSLRKLFGNGMMTWVSCSDEILIILNHKQKGKVMCRVPIPVSFRAFVKERFQGWFHLFSLHISSGALGSSCHKFVKIQFNCTCPGKQRRGLESCWCLQHVGDDINKPDLQCHCHLFELPLSLHMACTKCAFWFFQHVSFVHAMFSFSWLNIKTSIKFFLCATILQNLLNIHKIKNEWQPQWQSVLFWQIRSIFGWLKGGNFTRR